MANEQAMKQFIDVVSRRLSGNHIGNVVVMHEDNFNGIQKALMDLPRDLLREVLELEPDEESESDD